MGGASWKKLRRRKKPNRWWRRRRGVVCEGSLLPTTPIYTFEKTKEWTLLPLRWDATLPIPRRSDDTWIAEVHRTAHPESQFGRHTSMASGVVSMSSLAR